jgi:hypothetical protein
MPAADIIAMSAKFKSNTTPEHFAKTILKLANFNLSGPGTLNSTTFSDIVSQKRAGK